MKEDHFASERAENKAVIIPGGGEKEKVPMGEIRAF